MLASQLAKSKGLTVLSTTRNSDKIDALLNNGADHVILDEGNISNKLREIYPDGVNKVLELIGTRTHKDSLKCISEKGTVCMTGILGNEWTINESTPMGDIPSLGRLTVYMCESKNLTKELLQEFIDGVEKENIIICVDKIFDLSEVNQAHQ